MKSRHSD